MKAVFAICFLALSALTIQIDYAASQSLPNQCVHQRTDCSTPTLISVGVPGAQLANETFVGACVRHDGCYRYGAKTYGLNREQCDKDFKADMDRKCEAFKIGSGIDIVFPLVRAPKNVARRTACDMAKNVFYEAVRARGASSFKSGENSRFCRYDAGRENMHIHEIGPNAELSPLRHVGLWTRGWNRIRPFRVGGHQFIWLQKASSGLIHIRRINPDGSLGFLAHKYDFKPGWNNVEFGRIGNQTFVLLHNTIDRRVHLRRMSPSGGIGGFVRTDKWTIRWTDAEFFNIGRRLFLLVSHQPSGRVQIARVSPNGNLSVVRSYDWSSGWSTLEVFENRGRKYLLLLKASTGDVHLHQMSSDGSVGRRILDEKWDTNWTTVEPVEINGASYIFLLKAKNGQVAMKRVGENGVPVLPAVWTRNWSGGWSSAKFYETRAQTHMILNKSVKGGR